MSDPVQPFADRPRPVADWREGWWWYRSWGCDVRDWAISIPLPELHIQPRKEYGLYWRFGPWWAWVTLEKGHELFENGKRVGCGVGPA